MPGPRVLALRVAVIADLRGPSRQCQAPGSWALRGACCQRPEGRAWGLRTSLIAELGGVQVQAVMRVGQGWLWVLRAGCRARAATSLSFLYLLEGRTADADSAIELALATDG